MSRGGTVHARFHHLLQVAAGAEGLLAGAGEDGDAQCRVALETVPRRAQTLAHLAAQAVARIGPIRW